MPEFATDFLMTAIISSAGYSSYRSLKSKLHKELKTIQSSKIKDAIKKLASEMNRHFSEKEAYGSTSVGRNV